MKKTSIIVPCYNEKENIRMLAARFARLKSKYQIELILVDNGSDDGTEEEIIKCAEKYSFILPEKVEVNQGYGYGILKGLQRASGTWL